MSNNRHWLVTVGLVVLVGLVAWIGYSSWVMTLDDRYEEMRAVLQVDERVAPGAEVGVQVTTTDRWTGQPRSGREVVVEVGDEDEIVAEGETDEDGLFATEVRAPEEPEDVEVRARVDTDGFEQVPTAQFSVDRDHSLLVQTDKPRYQPGQEIQIRALVRRLGAGAVQDGIGIRVEDPDGTVLFDRTAESNEHGMAQIEFPLADVAEEGDYRIVASYRDAEQTEVVEVDDYRLPNFGIDVDIGDGHYRPGQTVEIQLDADYFFGEPVADGRYDLEGTGYLGEMESFEQFEGRLDDRGEATVEIQLPDYFVGTDDQLGFAVLEIEVTDGAGDTEKTVEEIPVAEDDILVEAIPAGGQLVEGVANEVWMTTRTPAGRPVAATVRIDAGTGSEPTVVETNESGVGSVRVEPESLDREWSVRAVGREDDRRIGTADLDLGEESHGQLGLVVERPGYQTGQTVAAQLVGARPSATVYLEVVGQHETHFTEAVQLEDHRASFDFDVTSEMSEALEVRAWMVGDGGEMARTAAVVPVADADELDLEVAPTADEFTPGQEAGIRVRTSEGGEPVAASVGLDVVDESVFAVGGDDRDEVVADRLGIEPELMEPTVWMYGSGPSGPKSGAERFDGQFHCGQRYAHIEPSAGLVDGFDEMLETIHARQSRQAEYNGLVVVAFLVLIPLAMIGWVFAHRRRDWKNLEVLKDAGLGVLAVVVAATGLWLVAMDDGGIVAKAVFLAVLASPLALLGWGLRRGRRRFQGSLMLLWAAWLAVGGAGEFWLTEVVDTSAAVEYLPLVGLAALGMVAALLPVIGRWLSTDRWIEALGLIAMAALPVCAMATALLGSERAAETVEDVEIGGIGAPADQLAEEGTARDMPDEKQIAEGDVQVEAREFFPETLYSDIVLTGEDGEAVVDLEMADSITNWKIDAVGATADGALGTASGDATVFQPFFIEPRLPTALTRGDRVVVPVSVFNYSDEPLELTVELDDRDWFEADAHRVQLEVAPDSVDGVEFEVTATEHGEHSLEWLARARSQTTAMAHSDRIRREVSVEPDGERRTEVASGRVDGVTTESVEVPTDIVDDSQQAVVEFRPGVTGEIVEGMEALIGMPTGCFEQTSSTLFPSAMALRYLEETERGSPELRTRAERYVAEGYQRILGFEVVEGGYSLFGRAPADPTVTAYGLRMLSEIDEVYSVDGDVLEEMAQFVGDHQNRDGSWDSKANTDYVVGITDRPGLTAFIGWSLAMYDPSDPAVGKALDYVVDELDVASAATRDVALALNLVVEAGESDRFADRIVDELVERAVEEDDGVRWSRDENGRRVGRAAAVENTALVARALDESNRHPALARGAVEYLVESKSGRGWGTTRATVAALGVLATTAGLGETVEEGELAVEIGGETAWSVPLDDQTAGEAHFGQIEVGEGTTDVDIDGPEESGYQWRLETHYHTPWEERGDADEELAVEVDYDRTRLTVDDRVEATARVRADDRVGMALVEVGIPPGFDPDTASLDEAVGRGEISDWELTQRRVTLYVEDVEGIIETSFEMVATQPIEASSGSSRTLDYYEPDRSAETGPVEFVVR